MKLQTVELTPQDIDCAASFIATAFFDNPAHIYIFPESHNRFEKSAIDLTIVEMED